jgi:hypothetical protein
LLRPGELFNVVSSAAQWSKIEGVEIDSIQENAFVSLEFATGTSATDQPNPELFPGTLFQSIYGATQMP